MVLFNGLRDNFIGSWEELCSEFMSHFNAKRKRLKTMADLNVIV